MPPGKPRADEGAEVGRTLPDDPALLRVILAESVAFLDHVKEMQALADGLAHYGPRATDESLHPVDRTFARDNFMRLYNELDMKVKTRRNRLDVLLPYRTREEKLSADVAGMLWDRARENSPGIDVPPWDDAMSHYVIYVESIKRIRDECIRKIESPGGRELAAAEQPTRAPRKKGPNRLRGRNDRIMAMHYEGKADFEITAELKIDYPKLTDSAVRNVISRATEKADGGRS